MKADFEDSSLCIVGNINRDLRTAPIAPGEHLFRDGETSTASIVETVGGGGANTAFAAAALGARVAFLGKVGRDALGDRLERTLNQHGVEAYLAKDPDRATGTSIALTFNTGHRHFISSLPASEALSIDDLDLSALAGKKHLLRADVWFSDAMLFSGNALLFKMAREQGLQVSLDLNWDPQWGSDDPAKIKARKAAVRAVLPWVHLAHGNVRELVEFADAPDLETALKKIADWGVEAVVVHLGAQGAGYFRQGKLVTEPAAPVAEHRNTTGTGDVLSLCMMLQHHQPHLAIGERLRIANRIVAEYMEGRRALLPPLGD